jgi:hypothetical protein
MTVPLLLVAACGSDETGMGGFWHCRSERRATAEALFIHVGSERANEMMAALVPDAERTRRGCEPGCGVSLRPHPVWVRPSAGAQ